MSPLSADELDRWERLASSPRFATTSVPSSTILAFVEAVRALDDFVYEYGLDPAPGRSREETMAAWLRARRALGWPDA